jgi:hypothetical protein
MAGRYLQVIYVLKTAEEIPYDLLTLDDLDAIDEEEDVLFTYVIHSRELTAAEKRQYRRL